MLKLSPALSSISFLNTGQWMWRICQIVTADELGLYISNTTWKLWSLKTTILILKEKQIFVWDWLLTQKTVVIKTKGKAFPYFFPLNFWAYTEKFDNADICTMLFSKLLDFFFLLACPTTREWKAEYTSKNENKRRKKEGEISEVTKQKFLLSNHWRKIYEIGGLQHSYHSLPFSNVH